MEKEIKKIPVIDPSRCTKCNKCIVACPEEAIVEHLNTSCEKCIKYCMSMHVPCSPEYIVFNYDRCDSCGECISACPHRAIRWFEPGIGPGKEEEARTPGRT